MADDSGDSPAPNNFECTFCRRGFTKKEHLKPFKCAICDRSFSRGDVLNRHVKSHKQTPSSHSAPDTSPPGFPTPIPDVPLHSGSRNSSTANPGISSTNNSASISHIVWSSASRPGVRLAHHEASSLLWPDSEDLFQSLTSTDGMTWDQSLPGLGPPAYPPHETPYAKLPSAPDRSRQDDLGAAEDGHRAVQTVNGLLTNTLFDVTSHVELSDLTPRFLDSSLHMFFTKFIPILPVIHRPTFVYRDCSAPLLLNAIALGSLFLGTEDATAKGEALWRLAYTAIATSWPEMIGYRREYDVCSGVELVLTALLSQSYAALSKNPTLRMTSQTFYGLSMHWAQYCGMYDVGRTEAPDIPLEHDSIDARMHAWRSWAARETQLRTLLGLCVIDGVVSQFSGNLVNTWPSTSPLPLAADEAAFAADTADKWIRHMATARTSQNSMPVRFCDLYQSLFSDGPLSSQIDFGPGLLSLKILLEIMSSLATNFDTASQGSGGAQSKFRAVQALGHLRRHIACSMSLKAGDKAIGLLRWHAVCLDLVASTARGARRMCHHFGITQHIFGGKKRQEERQVNPQAWAQGLPARKCLLHALEIHKIASEVPLGVAHDVCLPGTLFAAATTYSSFALAGVSKALTPTFIDWETVILLGLEEAPEMSMSSTAEEARDTLVFLKGSPTSRPSGWVARNLIYELSSIRILLHSLSQHWGVTQEMEEVVGAWEAHFSNDPQKIYEEYRYLRQKCPIIHTNQYGGYWLMTRYEDVKRAAMDSDTYISSVKAVVPSDPRGIRRPPLNFDAPAHTPFRTALERTVKPARLKRLAEPLRKHAEAELAPLLARGRGDISAEFAASFVARMESEWLNLDPDVAPKLATAAAAWLNAWRMQDGETVTANSTIMYEIARDLLADRQVNPRDPEEDPASSLLLERDAEGNPLSEEHLIGCLRQSLVVGVVAPPILIGSICKHLSEHKDLQQKLREDESLIPAAMDEFLRLYSPYRGFARTTSKEVHLHGKTIRPKEPVTLCYTAANRDPEVFENPDEFIIGRENIAAHMGFGRGRHRCAGMPLARLTLDIVLRAILRNTHDFEVDGELQYSRMPELGIISCPMKFL
ncbi:cytochrome P450 [Thozetella sp. PMI_491]|nr:cytochrome P450 [Thozetella sp. PMI_491]